MSLVFAEFWQLNMVLHHAGLQQPESCIYNSSRQQRQQQQQQQSEAHSHHSRPQPVPCSQRRVSQGSGSGLQSPPYEEQEDFIATLPTDELKSALFGLAKPQQQANTAGLGYDNGAGMTRTAAATAASSGQLRQQVLKQLRAKQDKPAGLAGSHESTIAAHHQKACEPFAGFANRQDVRHNARLWNVPKLAAEFSLHNNPLAEQHSEHQVAPGKAASPSVLAAASKQELGSEACVEHVLSLSELASIDPSQL